MSLKLNIHNVELAMKKIANLGGPGATKVLIDTLNDAMAQDVYPLWIRNISYGDHSQDDLDRLKNPYARRLAVDSGPHPDYIVHVQSGALLAGSAIVPADESNQRAVITESAPEYIDLRYGTSVMRMRDPGGEAMAEALPAIKARFAGRFPHNIMEIIGK